MSKNTRLVYTDDINLKIYQSLPEKDFKEFMMVYLTYQKGDDVSDKFTNPTVYALFMTYISKIEYNEEKWEKQARVNKENGKKGGRPKKNNQDIQPDTEFDTKNENKDDFRPEIPKDDIRVQQDIESVPNLLKTGKNEELHIPSDVIDEMGHYANDDSIPINERYSNISRLFKPYSRNIPSHKINDYINSIYNKLREVA